MKLIDFQPQHEADFYEMCRQFFSSPAVCHPISDEAMKTTFQTALSSSVYMRGLMIEETEEIIGYLLLSFTYSNEVGGMVVWIEEIFIKENHRRKGVGRAVLQWVISQYSHKAKRFRLEVTKENILAKTLYQSLGFETLPYEQMTLEDC